MDTLKFVFVVVTLSSSVTQTSGQATSCDYTYNKCVNGHCELQSNQQLGCTCLPGYILDPYDPLVCHPIPPCNLLPLPPDQQCLNGVCTMSYTGEYECACHQGFTLSADNPNICEDVNECMVMNTGCLPGACTDLPGDYLCSACSRGLTLYNGKCYYQQAVSHNNNNNVNVNQPSNQATDMSPLLLLMMENLIF